MALVERSGQPIEQARGAPRHVEMGVRRARYSTFDYRGLWDGSR